jgi:hypothetical protein
VREAGSYSEVTVSGEGLRVIGWVEGGWVSPGKRPMDGGGTLEIYRGVKKYITISGNGSGTLVSIDGLIDRMAREYTGKTATLNGNGRAATPKRPLNLMRLKFIRPSAEMVALANKHGLLDGGKLCTVMLYSKPGPDDDRSSVMYWFARCLLERGWPPDDARALIQMSAWNKHDGEKREERMLDKLIERAWSLPFTEWRRK